MHTTEDDGVNAVMVLPACAGSHLRLVLHWLALQHKVIMHAACIAQHVQQMLACTCSAGAQLLMLARPAGVFIQHVHSRHPKAASPPTHLECMAVQIAD